MTSLSENGGENNTVPKRPITKKWWFWTIIVVVALFAVVAAAPQSKREVVEVSEDKQREVIDTSDDSTADAGEVKLAHGELLSTINSCHDYADDLSCNKSVTVVKAKIKPSYNNKATINQNYYNAAGYVRDSAGKGYDELQYWAIAGDEESKVISFTISKDLIQKILNNKVVDNQLGNYVDDLWVNPSLKD